MKKFSFEIEGSNGDTVMAFEIGINKNGELEILQTRDCNLADVDGDYIFNTDNDLYRIQLNKN